MLTLASKSNMYLHINFICSLLRWRPIHANTHKHTHREMYLPWKYYLCLKKTKNWRCFTFSAHHNLWPTHMPGCVEPLSVRGSASISSSSSKRVSAILWIQSDDPHRSAFIEIQKIVMNTMDKLSLKNDLI